MATWTDTDLATIGSGEELELSSRRPDGTLRPFVTMWVVRVADDVYVRSAHGTDNGWYRRAVASGTGRIRAGGVEADVDFDFDFATADAGVHDQIDAAYHAKYDRYGPSIVGTVVGPDVGAVTIRLNPRDANSTDRSTS